MDRDKAGLGAMKTQTPRQPARYPIGTSVIHWDRRARIISVKWSPSGWWYEIRYPNSLTHVIPERLVVATED